MSVYIKITNKGEVDVNAFRLMGATTKNENQIGYFGSGIKYAVATALRKGIPLKVFSGDKEIKISTKTTTLRDQEFQVVCINGHSTSITTNMGRDWKTWFIFREFFCNAIDEGEHTLAVSDSPYGEKGITSVFIELTNEMKEIFDSLDHYFSQRRKPVHEAKGRKAYHRIGDHLTAYRKGIRVFNGAYVSLYDYDFPDLSINEAREASDWDVSWKVINFWKEHATSEMILQLINDQNCAEFNLNWTYGMDYMSRVWLETLKDKLIIPKEYGGYFADDLSNHHIILPHALCKELHKNFGKDLRIRGMDKSDDSITVLPTTEKELILIQDSLAFLKNSDRFKDIEAYPIKVVIFEGEQHRLGQAKNGEILLSKNLFLKGRRMLVETLLEEYIHAKNDVDDRTRAMQNILIDFVISTLEDKTQQYL